MAKRKERRGLKKKHTHSAIAREERQRENLHWRTILSLSLSRRLYFRGYVYRRGANARASLWKFVQMRRSANWNAFFFFFALFRAWVNNESFRQLVGVTLIYTYVSYLILLYTTDYFWDFFCWIYKRRSWVSMITSYIYIQSQLLLILFLSVLLSIPSIGSKYTMCYLDRFFLEKFFNVEKYERESEKQIN